MMIERKTLREDRQVPKLPVIFSQEFNYRLSEIKSNNQSKRERLDYLADQLDIVINYLSNSQ